MDIQEIADSLQPFTPVIQWGAVSQKWHVTFADWKDDVYTGDTILLALQAAQQGLQADAEAAYQVEKHGDWKYWQERDPSWKLPRR